MREEDYRFYDGGRWPVTMVVALRPTRRVRKFVLYQFSGRAGIPDVAASVAFRTRFLITPGATFSLSPPVPSSCSASCSWTQDREERHLEEARDGLLPWRAGTKNKTLSIDSAILRYERVDEAATHCGTCDGDLILQYRRTLAALLDRLSRQLQGRVAGWRLIHKRVPT